MATHRISCLGANTLPDTSGNVFMQPYPVLATNGFWKHAEFAFLDTATKDSLYTLFHVPENYVGNAKFYFIWTAGVTTGNVVWDADYRVVGGDDTTSLDQSTAQESLAVTASPPSAANNRRTPSVTPTAGNFTAGSTVELKISRDGSSGSDTMAATAQLMDVIFEYTDV